MSEESNTETEARDTNAAEKTPEGASSLAGKYLTFRLGMEEHGIEILKVVEIIKKMEITKVPRTPDFVRGVINLRGKVIPVVELRLKFTMESIEDTDETCIIVVNVRQDHRDIQMSILVDTVSEVLEIEGANIEPPPKFGSDIDTAFIRGMAKVKKQVIILLDIDKVLSGEEVQDFMDRF